MDTDLFATLRTEIAGVSVTDLARDFGTPTYVYDADQIRQRIGDLRDFDTVRYAMKACSNLAILDLCRRNGTFVDCVSGGEIRRALAAGFPATGDGHPMVYTADLFDRDALELVGKHGIHVNCGSPDMIEQMGEVAPGTDITLRINPGFGHGHSQKTNTGGESSKHGIWHEQLGASVERAAANRLTLSGIHVHIGSGTDLEHLSQVCGVVGQLAAHVGSSVTTISAGGGLPIRYRETDPSIDLGLYYSLWDETRKQLEAKFGHAVRLEIEPGRYLVAESGFLVSEVRAVKSMGNNLFYLVDAGFNNLARPVMYGAYHPMAIAPAQDAGRERAMHDVVVGGPLCESGDIFTQEEGGFVRTQALPEAQVGDFLVIGCAGAYGFCMASNYNSKLLPAEVLVHRATAHVIRARQSYDDLVRDETIPSLD